MIFRSFYGVVWIKQSARFSSQAAPSLQPIIKYEEYITVAGGKYKTDEVTNIRKRIMKLAERKLHLQRYSPISLLSRRISDYFQRNYRKRYGTSPLFTVIDNLSPVVSVWQNFDSLLVPTDHVSRSPSDTYYLNADTCLRAHTSAHQSDLIQTGLDAFLVVGDVYRRDAIDRQHFPVFHQMEGVRLFSPDELLGDHADQLRFFEDLNGKSPERTREKQELLTQDASTLVEHNLKSCLEGLVEFIFGTDVQKRWVDAYFPFTHPSFELEVFHEGEWIETLGCGVVEQKILQNSGAGYKIGWAFGLGLDRLAMKLYKIPDIRLFWSTDTGVTHQFETEDCHKAIEFVPISRYPQCINDMSFWLPEGKNYSNNDFYEIIRDIAGDMAEHAALLDEYVHPKSGRRSQCYRIYYRSVERTLKKEEVNEVHEKIAKAATETLGVEIR